MFSSTIQRNGSREIQELGVSDPGVGRSAPKPGGRTHSQPVSGGLSPELGHKGGKPPDEADLA